MDKYNLGGPNSDSLKKELDVQDDHEGHLAGVAGILQYDVDQFA
jgi:hypothetical protein